MDFKVLLSKLADAEKEFNIVKEQELKREFALIEQEVPLVIDFAKSISEFSKVIDINGEKCVLLYVFDSNGKTLISPEVFITQKGLITYKVFDEVNYLKYRPNAIIVDGYNYVELSEFLRTVPFSQIYNYFIERVEVLEEDVYLMQKSNIDREKFINNFKKNLQ